MQHQVKRKPKQWKVARQWDRKRLGRNGPDSRMSGFSHVSILQTFRCILQLLGTFNTVAVFLLSPAYPSPMKQNNYGEGVTLGANVI